MTTVMSWPLSRRAAGAVMESGDAGWSGEIIANGAHEPALEAV